MDQYSKQVTIVYPKVQSWPDIALHDIANAFAASRTPTGPSTKLGATYNLADHPNLIAVIIVFLVAFGARAGRRSVVPVAESFTAILKC